MQMKEIRDKNNIFYQAFATSEITHVLYRLSDQEPLPGKKKKRKIDI